MGSSRWSASSGSVMRSVWRPSLIGGLRHRSGVRALVYFLDQAGVLRVEAQESDLRPRPGPSVHGGGLLRPGISTAECRTSDVGSACDGLPPSPAASSSSRSSAGAPPAVAAPLLTRVAATAPSMRASRQPVPAISTHPSGLRELDGLGPCGWRPSGLAGRPSPMALLAERCSDGTSGLADYAVCGTLRIARATPTPRPTRQVQATARPAARIRATLKPAARRPVSAVADDCTSGYSPCIPNGLSDVDCAGGGGNGPRFTRQGVTYRVTGTDPYRLDNDGDGRACE